MELELPKPIALTVALMVVVMVCAALGYRISPRTAEGRPVLLSPEVRVIETYRGAVIRWVDDWQVLAASLHIILETDSDLFTASQQAQTVFNLASELVGEAEATESPAALIGLSDQASITARAFATASLASVRWVSAPTVENKSVAENELALAEQALSVLKSSEWLRGSP